MGNAVTSPAFAVFSSAVRNIFDFIFFITLGMYYRILYNKKVFHANLTILLVLFPLAYVVALVPPIVRDIIQHFYILSYRENDWVNMVIDIGQYSASYNLLVLVTERAFATLYVARYEYICSKTPWLGSLLALFQWIVSVTLLFINYYYSGQVIDAEPLLYSVGVSCAIAAVVFALLPLISHYAYKKQLEQRFNNAKRYQSIENIRSATLLRRLVLLSVIVQLFCGALYAYIVLKTFNQEQLVYRNLYYALLALIATLLNYVVVLSHPTLRKEFNRLTRLDRYMRRKDSQEISSVQGSRLDVPLSEHTDFYFQSYRNSW